MELKNRRGASNPLPVCAKNTGPGGSTGRTCSQPRAGPSVLLCPSQTPKEGTATAEQEEATLGPAALLLSAAPPRSQRLRPVWLPQGPCPTLRQPMVPECSPALFEITRT